MFERSSTSLLAELKLAYHTTSMNDRMQIIGSLDQYAPKDMRELAESIKLLELMKLKDSSLYKKLSTFRKFQNIHK